MLASDAASCPHCQREVGRPPLGLGRTDTVQEGSSSGGSGGGEDEGGRDEARSSEDGASSGLGKEDEEEQADGATRLCGDVWRETRAKLRGIVDSKYFNRGIMMAILVNTVSMGIEHHEQASGVGARTPRAWAGGVPSACLSAALTRVGPVHPCGLSSSPGPSTVEGGAQGIC